MKSRKSKQTTTLTPLNLKKKVQHQQRLSRRIEKVPSFVPALRTVSKVALMAAAAPDEILTRRSPKVPNSWHMRVPNINSVRAGRSSPVSLSPKIKNESL